MSAPTLHKERAGEVGVDRRGFLNGLTAAALLGTGAVMALFNVIFLRPRVTYGPPSKLRVGRPESYGSRATAAFPGARMVVRRDGDRFAAISTVCTHLGCLVKATEKGFDCPCHGSAFGPLGQLVRGPAPKGLPWLAVTPSGGGSYLVDEGKEVKAQIEEKKG